MCSSDLARDGGDTLKAAAVNSLDATIQELTEGEPSGLRRLFSLRHEFPTEWQRFKASTDPNPTFQCRITPDRFPYFLQGKPFRIAPIDVYPPQQQEPLDCSPTVEPLEPEGSHAWTLTVPCGLSPLPADLFVLLHLQLM